MSRLLFAATASAMVFLASPEARRQAVGRALTIEDYYRIQTIGNASFSPSGAWVAFTVSTRLEEPDAHSTRTESWAPDGEFAPVLSSHDVPLDATH